MEKIENHSEEAKKRLLKQFQNSKILNALIETLGERFQELEDELFNLYLLNYLNAEGNKLEDFGDIIGVLKNGMDDEKFKNLLTAAICENNSEGTIEDLIQICRLLTRPKMVLLFEPSPNQVSIVAINPQPLADLKTISKALKSSKLANAELSSFFINLDSPFMFSESKIIKSSGFGMEEIPNSGGRFAFELE